MRFIDASYETIRDYANRLAAEYKQRVAAPHLVLAIIRTQYWPQSAPVGAEDFCQAVIQSLPREANAHPEPTLYARMVLDRSDDATSIVFYLFWSPWAQDEAFVRTWHQLQWAPPVKVPSSRSKPLRPPGPMDKADEGKALSRWQRSQVWDRQQREWPTRVREILRGIDTDTIRFACTYAIDYASFSVVGGIGWVENHAMAQPGIRQVEIESMTGGTTRVWQHAVHDSMGDAQLQRADYRFIGDVPFTLTESDTLWAVSESGQRWCLLPFHSPATG